MRKRTRVFCEGNGSSSEQSASHRPGKGCRYLYPWEQISGSEHWLLHWHHAHRRCMDAHSRPLFGCLLLYRKRAVKEFFTFFHSPIPIVHQSGFISCFHQQEHTDLIRFKDNFPINDLIFNLNQFAVLTHKHQLQASDFLFHAGNTQTNRTIGLNGFGFL